MSGINAAQARANSESSTYGAPELVRSISSSIEANSKSGATSITQSASKEAINDTELAEAITALKGRGFSVECKDGPLHHTLKVSW